MLLPRDARTSAEKKIRRAEDSSTGNGAAINGSLPSATTIPGDNRQDESHGQIRIRGARVHNLQDVDLDLPRDQLIVITGPSGSGKSSLAFDTLFAEGQRQYIDSLSIYARQFFYQMERPDVDSIEGLPPTICVDQRVGNQNPRSTVATVTEIYDYLRLLMARLGQPHCPNCHEAIRQQSDEQIVQRISSLPIGAKLILFAPVVHGRAGQHKEVLATIRKAGFVRARIDGEVVDLEQVVELSPRKQHSIDVVIDRLIIREGIHARLGESVQLALKHGAGALSVAYTMPPQGDQPPPQGDAAWTEEVNSTLYACPSCGQGFEELEPRSFSFNSPYGACAACDGLGVKTVFDADMVIPNDKLSLADDAILAWKGQSTADRERHRKALEPFLGRHKLRWDQPLSEWPEPAREQLFLGDADGFAGLNTLLEQGYATELDAARLERLDVLRGELPCRECGGSRLRAEARACRLGGKAIHEIARLTVDDALDFVASLKFGADESLIAKPILTEMEPRLRFLRQVGVGYLTLDRAADTLSGGEFQRVRLATALGAGLVGACYILDEPSIGLHPRDNEQLIEALRNLQRQGNTVLVVEHDEATMRAADLLIDMGPGAGANGGRIVATGPPAVVAANPDSLTGQFLAGVQQIELPKVRRRTSKSRSITLEGVTTNNLKEIDVRIPLQAMVCVTGVSGSGKSSLVEETLARALARRLGLLAPKPGPHRSLRGASQIDKLVKVDQSPLGRTPRSNPATYSGVFDEVRKLFATTREARQRGFSTARFSFNNKQGRCETCQGQGIQRIEMNFLPDMMVACPACQGARFNPQTLQIRYRDRSIADVLAMSIDEAAEFFENVAVIHHSLVCLQEVGLGYLTLGQASTTLSGGEAQRVKLATELARGNTGNTLYILDEPTTGLHFDDVRRLLAVLHRLVDLGNTVLLVEHNLDVMKSVDWIIDLGPEGGGAGGGLVAVGPPEELAAVMASHTGKFLRPILQAAGVVVANGDELRVASESEG